MAVTGSERPRAGEEKLVDLETERERFEVDVCFDFVLLYPLEFRYFMLMVCKKSLEEMGAFIQ